LDMSELSRDNGLNEKIGSFNKQNITTIKIV
jgi:hypothetical protein